MDQLYLLTRLQRIQKPHRITVADTGLQQGDRFIQNIITGQ